MKLNDIMLANEDYILARYQNLLKKQNILTIEDLLKQDVIRVSPSVKRDNIQIVDTQLTLF